MHRQAILTLLNNYAPRYTEEVEYKERVIRFIQNHENCFERTCKVGHITGSSWLISPEGTHAFLMHHRKINIWVQPGGHCDGDTDVLAVALKEAQEESGIRDIRPISHNIFDIDIHTFPKKGDDPEHLHYDVRFFLQAQTSAITINTESNDAQWFPQNQNLNVFQSPSIKRMFQKWQDWSQSGIL